MAPNADPYRTLGLTRGATLAEVKQAYRRLAKANHPDAAGEAALPRFLAIQAAYDEIAGPEASGGLQGRPRRAGASPPWGADPDRADATHRAYGGRTRRTRTGGTRRSSGNASGGPTSGTASGAASGTPPPPGPDRPNRPPNKATLGSTSYDGAEGEPFEPDWGGASWYGTTSGTYWTLNPKEYADPRKHGPEYQARARRAAAVAREEDVAPEAGVRGPGADPAAPPAEADPPTHTTSSWWDATAGPAADVPFADDDPDAPGSADPVDGRTDRGLAGRVGVAVLGWIPIALGIGWIVGEVSGCGRFAATCDPAQGTLVWIAQLAVLAILIIWATRLGRRPVS
jgi:hypothetical protein